MPSATPRRGVQSRSIDGLKIRIIDDPTPIVADLGRVIRMLARMLVRNRETHGERQVIDGELGSSSPLTRAAAPRTDHTDEAA
jgi:hypothetical protein